MGKIKFVLDEFFLFVTRLFFLHLNNGDECVICGKRTLYFPVCGECKIRFFSVDDVLDVKRCKVCGKVLISTEEICTRCKESLILKHTDFVLPIFSYRLWNKQLMFLWKKRDVRSLSYFFAELYSRVLERIGARIIVPVPPRPGKIQENGWDQIDEICSYLKYVFGFEIFNVLERLSLSEQKKLDRKERLDSIGNAYKVCMDNKLKKIMKRFSDIVPREVCIIDDVSTTGATLESCASALKELGVEKVNVVTLFIVD